MAQSVQEFRPIKRTEYDRMVDLGMFEDEKIELLEGMLVPMNPIGPPHSSAIDMLGEILVPRLLGRARVRIQNPYAALETSQPQPDLAVVPLARYREQHPEVAHLVIEVAESPLAKDRGIKRRIYASNGVPEYWIVNVVESCIEVHLDPSAGGYRTVTRVGLDGEVGLLAFPDVCFLVRDILE